MCIRDSFWTDTLFRNSYFDNLAVPTRVRLTLIHAIWPTSFAILSVSGGEQKGNPRWISIYTDRLLKDDQYALLFIPSGAPTRQISQASIPRDAGEWRSCQGATPGSSALGSVREPRPNGRPGRMTVYPSSSTPSMIDHIIPPQSAHSNVGTTRRQRMRCLSGLAWPPLL